MEKEAKIAKVKKYFETPQGILPNPKYVQFALSLLERADPCFIDTIASFNLDGEVTLRWEIDVKKHQHIYLHLVHHIPESEEEISDPNDFDILTSYHYEGPWFAHDISFSEKEKVSRLLEAFEQSRTMDEFRECLWPTPTY